MRSKDRKLQAARVEVAVQLCINRPMLYSKVVSLNPHYNDDAERLAAILLIRLMKLEPVIRHILDFYYKREGVR